MSKRNRQKREYLDLIRTADELRKMRESGRITALALKKTLNHAQPGTNLQELERVATEEIIKWGGKPAFKMVPNYHWTTCLTVNDEVVHGIPRDIVLKSGDLLSVDLGAIFKQWYTDAAWSVIVGESTGGKLEFLKVGERALWQAVDQSLEGNRIGDISSALQTTVESAGYSIVKSLAGHGVGRSYHEEPEILGYGTPTTGKSLFSGMTIAIEAIYTQGSGRVYEKDDGWTIASADGSLGGLFEMTVIINKDKPEVITDWRVV